MQAIDTRTGPMGAGSGVVSVRAASGVTIRGGTIVSPRIAARAFADDELLARAGVTRREAKKMDRFSLLALAAARTLVEELPEDERAACGFICGNMMAGWSFTEPQLRALHASGPSEVSPYLASAWFPAAPQGQVAIHLGIRGHAKTLATDRCAGAQAIDLAARRIASGQAPLMLAGAVEAPVSGFVEAAMRQSGGSSDSLAEAAALLLLAPADPAIETTPGTAPIGPIGPIRPIGPIVPPPAPAVRIGPHATFRLGTGGAAALTARIAGFADRCAPRRAPAAVVCSTGCDDAQIVLARSIVRDLFPGADAIFPSLRYGETLAASSAIAAVIASKLAAAGEAVLVFSLGHFDADLLWFLRPDDID